MKGREKMKSEGDLYATQLGPVLVLWHQKYDDVCVRDSRTQCYVPIGLPLY